MLDFGIGFNNILFVVGICLIFMAEVFLRPKAFKSFSIQQKLKVSFLPYKYMRNSISDEQWSEFKLYRLVAFVGFALLILTLVISLVMWISAVYFPGSL